MVGALLVHEAWTEKYKSKHSQAGMYSKARAEARSINKLHPREKS